MLHDERILKNKFAYFFTIIFVLGWLIYYSAAIINILFKNYGIVEQYRMLQIPIYLLIFLTFILLIITFINIFKEAKRMFLCLNISISLICILWSISFFNNYKEGMDRYLYSFLIFIALLIGSGLLINYFKHSPSKNEIDSIGTHND
ncbi:MULTISPECIES: hypothetical protein [unclassified Chryseobacterium]|uniref:hypothetical protein n=1 Tax=unclassified Chryseobacterium TaxID=2593645 RepID=UPI002269B1DB|nr:MULTISPECIES: hypothetical protein [unclassified Chryseobacterium]